MTTYTIVQGDRTYKPDMIVSRKDHKPGRDDPFTVEESHEIMQNLYEGQMRSQYHADIKTAREHMQKAFDVFVSDPGNECNRGEPSTEPCACGRRLLSMDTNGLISAAFNFLNNAHAQIGKPVGTIGATIWLRRAQEMLHLMGWTRASGSRMMT